MRREGQGDLHYADSITRIASERDRYGIALGPRLPCSQDNVPSMLSNLHWGRGGTGMEGAGEPVPHRSSKLPAKDTGPVISFDGHSSNVIDLSSRRTSRFVTSSHFNSPVHQLTLTEDLHGIETETRLELKSDTRPTSSSRRRHLPTDNPGKQSRGPLHPSYPFRRSNYPIYSSQRSPSRDLSSR